VGAVGVQAGFDLSFVKGNDMKPSGLKLGLMVQEHVRVDWY
jgi:hypothetical protein